MEVGRMNGIERKRKEGKRKWGKERWTVEIFYSLLVLPTVATVLNNDDVCELWMEYTIFVSKNALPLKIFEYLCRNWIDFSIFGAQYSEDISRQKIKISPTSPE